DVERFGNRKTDVIGDRLILDADRQALFLQPVALTSGARPQRPVRFEFVLLGPAAVVEAAAQVRNQPFELLPRAEEQDLARFPRQAAERDLQIDAEVARQGLPLIADQLLLAPPPRPNPLVRAPPPFVGVDP